MYWNYRLMAHTGEGEIYIEIHEVHYDENDLPTMFTANATSIGGENITEISWSIQRMKECLSKPIIWADERFPESYTLDTDKNIHSDEYFIDSLKIRVDEIKANLSKRTSRINELFAGIEDAFIKFNQQSADN